ncbi:MAG: hypothetical protein HN919_17095 [Verrucomicrobia bacterium]|jgi:hypothetical protein|nr:hypothetical protein [Verrucomicrobiota bacterium]
MTKDEQLDRTALTKWKRPLIIAGLCLLVYFLSFGFVSALYWRHDWYLYRSKIQRYKIVFAPLHVIHQRTPILNGYVSLWVRSVHPRSKTYDEKEIKRVLSGKWYWEAEIF